MEKFNWTLEKIRLPLKYLWKISRNETQCKTNYIIHLKVDGFHTVGEVAPNIRYGETPEIIEQQFNEFCDADLTSILSLEEFHKALQQFQICNALKAGIDMAYVHYILLRSNMSFCDYFEIPKPYPIASSFSIPILPKDQIHQFFTTHDLHRFQTIKLKINNRNAIESVLKVHEITQQPLRIDANESFENCADALMFFDAIRHVNVQLIEQPFSAEKMWAFRELKKNAPWPIFADESVQHNPDFTLLKECFDGINIKLMKTGGYLNALSLTKEAKKHSMKIMLGCMIETTLGISAAMHLSALADYIDLDGFLILEKEPFDLLEESDGIISFSK